MVLFQYAVSPPRQFDAQLENAVSTHREVSMPGGTQQQLPVGIPVVDPAPVVTIAPVVTTALVLVEVEEVEEEVEEVVTIGIGHVFPGPHCVPSPIHVRGAGNVLHKLQWHTPHDALLL